MYLISNEKYDKLKEKITSFSLAMEIDENVSKTLLDIVWEIKLDYEKLIVIEDSNKL